MIDCVTFYGEVKSFPKERLSFRPAVYGIVEDQGRLLLVKNRNNGKYTLPGGGVEIGEGIVDALIREVREETGIVVEVGDFLEFSERCFYYDPEDLAFHGLCFYYRCKPLSFALVAEEDIEDDEASEPSWVSIGDLKLEQFQHGGELILKEIGTGSKAE